MSEGFPNIPKIAFEGPKTRNPFAFKHYNPEEMVGDKSMRDHLRFACAYWHTMRGEGADPFGAGTSLKPWDDRSNSVENAQKRVGIFFEFLEKIGLDYYCFHDRDIAPEGATFAESCKNLEAVVGTLKEYQKETGKKLLWGTACAFTNPRYMHGAGTTPYADVFAYAAAQIKNAMDATKELGGENYVFWGGREGYMTLINTDMKRELDHLAKLLHMAVDYAKEIGFTGQFLIEPKPKEPTTHQYDSDSAACLNFLREYDLLDHFKLNLETNHATLAGHTMAHEMAVARTSGALGSLDANTGNELLGWDTDEFCMDVYTATSMMIEMLRNGGIAPGGLNFDAKVRRESFEPVDLVHAHVGSMDTFARGLKIAHAIIEDGRIDGFIKNRYSSFDSGIGADVEAGKVGFKELEAYTLKNGEPKVESGRQEMLQNIINEFI